MTLQLLNTSFSMKKQMAPPVTRSDFSALPCFRLRCAVRMRVGLPVVSDAQGWQHAYVTWVRLIACSTWHSVSSIMHDIQYPFRKQEKATVIKRNSDNALARGYSRPCIALVDGMKSREASRKDNLGLYREGNKKENPMRGSSSCDTVTAGRTGHSQSFAGGGRSQPFTVSTMSSQGQRPGRIRTR